MFHGLALDCDGLHLKSHRVEVLENVGGGILQIVGHVDCGLGNVNDLERVFVGNVLESVVVLETVLGNVVHVLGHVQDLWNNLVVDVVMVFAVVVIVFAVVVMLIAVVSPVPPIWQGIVMGHVYCGLLVRLQLHVHFALLGPSSDLSP